MSADDELPEPPAGLGAGGSALWASLTEGFDLASHELVMLKEACRTVDLLDVLQLSIDLDGPVLPWGKGTRANPAAVEARQSRIALARLFASLGIPADGEGRTGQRGAARGVYRMGGSA
jgi:hypothetical protein